MVLKEGVLVFLHGDVQNVCLQCVVVVVSYNMRLCPACSQMLSVCATPIRFGLLKVHGDETAESEAKRSKTKSEMKSVTRVN